MVKHSRIDTYYISIHKGHGDVGEEETGIPIIESLIQKQTN